jgi:hypothetical protein
MIAFVIAEFPTRWTPRETSLFASFQPRVLTIETRIAQQKCTTRKNAQFATSDDDFIHCPVSETGLSPRS